eukprot:TRINITY_DN7657_c1_g1_i1.p1 TRINITY_DN7657_c1_g1~~TRINITY_DN7657_c1_g1_i1.p1  ORF type:complete len:188 (-),score=2.72 TRINITY_DN7657_c1_g1_i1:312-875(-)
MYKQYNILIVKFYSKEQTQENSTTNLTQLNILLGMYLQHNYTQKLVKFYNKEYTMVKQFYSNLKTSQIQEYLVLGFANRVYKQGCEIIAKMNLIKFGKKRQNNSDQNVDLESDKMTFIQLIQNWFRVNSNFQINPKKQKRIEKIQYKFFIGINPPYKDKTTFYKMKIYLYILTVLIYNCNQKSIFAC